MTRRSRARSRQVKKAPTALYVSVGAILLLAGVLWLASRGETKSTNRNGSGAPVEQNAKAPTPRERFDAAVQAAEATSDTAEKTAHLLDAIELYDGGGVGEGAMSKRELRAKILEHDPNHAPTRRALGYVRYTGDHPDHAGEWVMPDDYKKITAEWQELEIAKKKAAAENALRARWETPFGRKAKRVADFYRRDVARVPDVDLRFYFDTKKIQKPYLLMVQDAEIPDPAATADLIGPGLAALRNQFRGAYAAKTLPSWDDSKFVVPVMILKDVASYERYRAHGHDVFPSTGLAAAFYVSGANPAIADVCRGTLYVWQGANEKKFYHELFHEATHQIMDNAAYIPSLPGTPWLSEGIAEFWGSYEGNQYTGYEFRRVLSSRMGTISRAARAYFDLQKQKRDGTVGENEPPTFLSPKVLLGVDSRRFNRAKAALEEKTATDEDRLLVESVYALGWAWIFYSHHGPAKEPSGKYGKYDKAFEEVLGLELHNRYNRDRLARAYGIQSDEDWDAITAEFFLFCSRKLREYVRGDLVPEYRRD